MTNHLKEDLCFIPYPNFEIFQSFPVKNSLIACAVCNETLQLCFDFKINCLNNESEIKANLNSNGIETLNLEQTFSKQLSVDLCIKTEITKVCRFCLKHCLLESCIGLNQMDQDMFLEDLITRSFPEMVRIVNRYVVSNFRSKISPFA